MKNTKKKYIAYLLRHKNRQKIIHQDRKDRKKKILSVEFKKKKIGISSGER